jgi:leucyl/phenylalanyl-tRNA---protein transferase
MPRFLDMLRSGHVTDDPVVALFHYLRGQMVNWVNGKDGPVHWVAATHRGMQFLDKVEFPRKQKRYIFSPQFEIRYDTAFADVIQGCADRSRDVENKTWISDAYLRAMVRLHDMGFAHSFEAWNDGKLVGGAFGVQMGSMITCDSMFHRMSNASKAAYGQTLVHLQKRGFKVVDTNGVASHQVNYGEEWVPRWRYEQLLVECLRESPSLTDARPNPPLPWEVRALLPALRPTRVVLRRLPIPQPKMAADPTQAPATDATTTTPTTAPPTTDATPSEPAKPEAAADTPAPIAPTADKN